MIVVTVVVAALARPTVNIDTALEASGGAGNAPVPLSDINTFRRTGINTLGMQVEEDEEPKDDKGDNYEGPAYPRSYRVVGDYY